MAKDKKTYAFSDLTEANFPEVAGRNGTDQSLVRNPY